MTFRERYCSGKDPILGKIRFQERCRSGKDAVLEKMLFWERCSFGKKTRSANDVYSVTINTEITMMDRKQNLRSIRSHPNYSTLFPPHSNASNRSRISIPITLTSYPLDFSSALDPQQKTSQSPCKAHAQTHSLQPALEKRD